MGYREDGVEHPQSTMAWEMNTPEDSTPKEVPGQESNVRSAKFLAGDVAGETSDRAHRVQYTSPDYNGSPERMTEKWGVSCGCSE